MADQLSFLIRNLPNLLIGFPNHRPGGLLLTIILAIVSIGVGFALAVPLGAALDGPSRAARVLARGYVSLVRGVPLVLLLLIIHQVLGVNILGLDLFGAQTTSMISAFVTLILFASSYQADIVASGLRGVPPGLIEDARVLGASRRRAFFTTQLPYALRVVRPGLVSQAISLFKDTSVVVVLGVADLTTTARIALGSDIDNAPYWVATYLTVGLLYFFVAFGVSTIAERRGRRGPQSGLVRTLGEAAQAI